MGKTELKLEIDADLLAQAEAAGIPLARLLEAELSRTLIAASRLNPANSAQRNAADQAGLGAQANDWAEENADAIEAYRKRIDEFGVFGEDLRRW